MPREIIVSSSTIGIMKDCPLCFWTHFHNNGLRRPRGIFPSLPSGMDGVLKEYYDQYRGSLTPEVKASKLVKGKLMEDLDLLDKWRDWRSGLKYKHPKFPIVLVGAFDDMIIDKKKYSPYDFKTKGSAPSGPNYGAKYYQQQVDIYSFLLKANKYKITGTSYLAFHFPTVVIEDKDASGSLMTRFGVEIQELETNPDNAKQLFEQAVELITTNDKPQPSLKCEYCNYRREE